MQGWLIILISFAYLGILFAIAAYGDRRADLGRSLIGNPYIYTLSLAVYCTAWTYYGSVGRAATDGVGFLPIYLGPTLMFALWTVLIRKIIRICKQQRITSIADFIGSRYGKSTALSSIVTIIAVVGIMPYIALQLKAISASFDTLLQYPILTPPSTPVSIFDDKAFYVTLFLIPFAILFGTRHLDAAERHEGMVTAIAFESLVKLVAFVVVGLFVTFVLFQGPADIFTRAGESAEATALLTFGAANLSYGDWLWLLLLSMFAILLLPRQFQVTVVENVDERHLKQAAWIFPLYLLAINIFVLPIAIGGMLRFPAGVDPDTFVLMLPLVEGQSWLALLAFIGGLSAATGMVIVETIVLSTMICNDLVMPALLRIERLRLNQRRDLTGLLLFIRRLAIVIIMVLGYIYFRNGAGRELVSIGLVSFAAVAQFAPALIGGLFWKRATRSGALIGLLLGFLVWFHTLLMPTFAQHTWWLMPQIMIEGPFGLTWLRPHALFGLDGLDPISHGMFWSMLVNIGSFVVVSLFTQQSALEQRQATLFVDGYRPIDDLGSHWSSHAPLDDLRALLARYLGPLRADELLNNYARTRRNGPLAVADAELIDYAETHLAGAIGAASARVVLGSVVKESALKLDEVMNILDEASQVLAYSRRLEKQSQELAAATAELQATNQRLQAIDRLKDDFIATITHELRTPITSIRAFGEILYDSPDLPREQQEKFLATIMKECERLTRIINQVLDLAKIESNATEWHVAELNLRDIIEASVDATSQLFAEKNVQLHLKLPDDVPLVITDQDRIIQVMLNLLSNAVKFVNPQTGWVEVQLRTDSDWVQIEVRDNGPGISKHEQRQIFEKFRQASSTRTGQPRGSGLGLTICREIITRLGGEIWVESEPGLGALFAFRLPRRDRRWQASMQPTARAAD
jgi:Na+/proline symporter/signal transduction histidine kinase